MPHFFLLLAVTFLALIAEARASSGLTIPIVEKSDKRLVTIDDIVKLRKVSSISISPDGRRFAVFVTQADPAANDYRTGWFVGEVSGDPLVHIGDGGNVRYEKRDTGHIIGDIEKREARWSPDGKRIAYLARRNGEMQLWLSSSTGGAARQITHNAGDVLEFHWSEDGKALYFTAETPRAEKTANEKERAQEGYRYDEDMLSISDLLLPERRVPLETNLQIWTVTRSGSKERTANAQERDAFHAARAISLAGVDAPFSGGALQNFAIPPVANDRGALAWLSRTERGSEILQVMASQSSDISNPISCADAQCIGKFERIWWNEDGERIFLHRREGVNSAAHGFYAWSPLSGDIALVLRAADDNYRDCAPAADDRLLCVRETKTRPDHIVAIDMRSSAVDELADVNPEFRNIRLGRVERFEWDTPSFDWSKPGAPMAGFYGDRAYGYIFYPPDFDPGKKYPVFIDPYVASGFEPSVGGEHALHVYAANGFIVLDTAFPGITDFVRLGSNAMKDFLYSEMLDFPHLTMLMESTLKGLDMAAARGFIDLARVGVGGVSHGAFVPLYMMQKHDCIAAISIGSQHWGGHEYYLGTSLSKKAMSKVYGVIGYVDWRQRPEGKGREFWAKIDPADHADELEAPILMNLPAGETFPVLRLIRHLRDAGKPYDAYIFDEETHIKWQPAHLYNIMHRNLDWFRFWLQDYEDVEPAKAEQYQRWRELRQLQCNNPRSLREYCR
jgi:dipeptidyl aminopeptidase/acylaminoacyl peptidase